MQVINWLEWPLTAGSHFIFAFVGATKSQCANTLSLFFRLLVMATENQYLILAFTLFSVGCLNVRLFAEYS